MEIESVHNYKVVMALSGGMDSTTLFYLLREIGLEVIPVGFNYGQKHHKELLFALNTCKSLHIDYKIVNLTEVFRHMRTRSTLLNESKPVPDGHYEDKVMQYTVVPNRNMILTSILTGIAIDIQASYVAYGAHFGDHAIYPDCRTEFIDVLTKAIKLADYQVVNLIAPFMNLSKTKVAAIGNHLGVNWNDTWSCYKGGSTQCGTCGTCVERNEALREAHIVDNPGSLVKEIEQKILLPSWEVM